MIGVKITILMIIVTIVLNIMFRSYISITNNRKTIDRLYLISGIITFMDFAMIIYSAIYLLFFRH